MEKLGRAYNLAVEEKRLSAQFTPKIPSLPENNVRQGLFEREELEALLPHLPEPVDDMVGFTAIHTRRSTSRPRLDCSRPATAGTAGLS